MISNGKSNYSNKSGTNSKTVVNEKPAPVVAKSQNRYRLTINIKGTQDEQDDLNRLRRIIYSVKEYSGRDEVSLRIINNGKIVKLRLPNIYTGYCPELHEQISELVGEGGLIVETLTDGI